MVIEPDDMVGPNSRILKKKEVNDQSAVVL